MATTLKTELLGKSGDLTKNEDGYSETLYYRVEGTNDPRQVMSDLNALGFAIKSTHPVYGTQSIVKEVLAKQDPEAPEYALLEVNYGPPDTDSNNGDFNDNNERWEFDLVAKQTKILSVESAAVDPTKTYARQWNGQGQIAAGEVDTAIGRNGNRVEGTSVYRPFGAMRCTKKYEDKAEVDAGVRNTIYQLQGKTNKAAFIGHAQKTVLFLGANVRYPGDTTAEVGYNFLFGFPQDVTVDVFYPGGGGAILTPAALGQVFPFETVAFTMGERTSVSDINVKVTAPERAGVYTTYLEGDFGPLGLVGP